MPERWRALYLRADSDQPLSIVRKFDERILCDEHRK
jgi:hypothetical protein